MKIGNFFKSEENMNKNSYNISEMLNKEAREHGMDVHFGKVTNNNYSKKKTKDEIIGAIAIAAGLGLMTYLSYKYICKPIRKVINYIKELDNENYEKTFSNFSTPFGISKIDIVNRTAVNNKIFSKNNKDISDAEFTIEENDL